MRARAGGALVQEGMGGRWRWAMDRRVVGPCGKLGIGRVRALRRAVEEKEGGVLARDAWAAGGEAGSAADGMAVAR